MSLALTVLFSWPPRGRFRGKMMTPFTAQRKRRRPLHNQDKAENCATHPCKRKIMPLMEEQKPTKEGHRERGRTSVNTGQAFTACRELRDLNDM